MAAVQRRPEPRKFLDASLMPLERALRARADVLEAEAAATDVTDNSELLIGSVKNMQALEWRLLADELHHW